MYDATSYFLYDKSGNRIRRVADGVEELYCYDPRNRLTQLSRGGVVTPFRYDSAGNLLADDKALYSYDAFNRTTKVETMDGNVQINRYDAEGLRHELEENGRLVQFIFSNSREVVAEQDENKWTLYIRASSLLASSTDHARTYYHYASDEMGSTTHIVDGEGAVQNRYVYDAWGNVTEQTENVPNRFKFNGQQLDPISQQYYLRARFYNPVIARFTQEDTYRGDGLNLYAYCANNPVVYADPTGHGKYKDPLSPEQRAIFDAAKANGKTSAQAYLAATGKNPLKPPMTWNEFQAANKGQWSQSGMSAAWQRYKASLPGAGITGYLHRPYLRQGTLDAIWAEANQRRNSQGWIMDPIAGRHMPGPYQVGHRAGFENSSLIRDAEALGMTQSEFNDWVNDNPGWFFIQNAELNESHLGEQDYLDRPGGLDRLLERAQSIIDRFQSP